MSSNDLIPKPRAGLLRPLLLPALFLVGAGLFVGGLWAWWPPAALIGGGALSMAIAYRLAGGEGA